MIRESILVPSLLALVALALGGCKSKGEHATQSHAEPEEVPEAQVTFDLERPTTSLAAAIATALQSVPGGRFLRAEIEDESEGRFIISNVLGDGVKERDTHFSILLASGDGVKKVKLDATTGSILATESEELEAETSALLASMDKDPNSAACTPVQAIEAALAKSPGGWAWFIGLGTDDGRLNYGVGVVDGKTLRVSVISAADGLIGQTRVFGIREAGEPGDSELTEEPAVSLARAIALARERAAGERFLHAELGRENGRANCLLVFWCMKGIHCLVLDAVDGALLNEGTFEADSEAGAQQRAAAERSSSAIDPAKAIEIAVATLPGSWAQLIDLGCEQGPLVYQVELVTGGLVREVQIRAEDGELLGAPVENPDDAFVSLASAIEIAKRLEPGAIVLEAGFDLSSSERPRDWVVLLAKADEQLRVCIGAESEKILRSEREVAGELARSLAAESGSIEVWRAIDAALRVVHGIAPDAQPIAALLANRDEGLVYQIALMGSSSGSRVVEVSAKDGKVLSVEPVETPHPMRR